MTDQVFASPARIAPLYKKIFTEQCLEKLYERLNKRYSLNKDDIFIVNGVEVHSYYSSQFKTRFFYSINQEDEYVEYYAQLSRSSDRGILDSKIKSYYQSIVYVNDIFGNLHRGFAQDVIWDVMFQYFIDSMLITDKEQTDDGFKMWKRLVANSYTERVIPIIFIYNPIDKQRYITKLEKRDIVKYLNKLEFLLFGDDYLKFSHRGIMLLKKPLESVLQTNKKIHILSIDEFIQKGKEL